jgi:hypothetical protein
MATRRNEIQCLEMRWRYMGAKIDAGETRTSATSGFPIIDRF